MYQGALSNPDFAWFSLPTVNDPSAPTNWRYERNMSCQYDFTVQAGKMVYILLQPCALESSTDCDKDKLTIPRKEGHMNVEHKVCGPESDGVEYYTGLNSVAVQFLSDGGGDEVGCSGMFMSCKYF